MKTEQFYRIGRTIREIGGKTTHHDSVNKAKRKSREIQLAEDGALGRGTVRVEL